MMEAIKHFIQECARGAFFIFGMFVIISLAFAVFGMALWGIIVLVMTFPAQVGAIALLTFIALVIYGAIIF